MADPAEPSGSRVTAPPPEPTPAERQSQADRAVAALMDADTLLFGIGFSPATSGQVGVASLRPIIDALHENLPALKRVVEEHDAEKAEVADAAYGKGRSDALAVSPGCRGAELAEAAQAVVNYESVITAREHYESGVQRAVSDLREALEAGRASGEAGPDA